MNIIKQIDALRENINQAKKQNKTIVFIPTMGFLHQGHLSMAELARRQDETRSKFYIVMSIFVNPLQFGPNEDYDKYPRDLSRDAELAQRAGVDIIFAPTVHEMYPEGTSLTTVSVAEVTEGLCGAGRPGHFQGVTTVVSKLFNIVQPDIAYFGQKDYQQAITIKKMVQDLNFPIEIIVAPTVREQDGLAMSSRNSYLSPEERRQAPVLYRSLQEGAALIKQGETRPEIIREKIVQRIRNESTGQIEYVEIRNADNLATTSIIDSNVVIALAVRLGSTRLIDNIVVEV
ncbi:MAG: pantoate--beta-alanine ligase [Peptococcaceae bacterium]|jgi:pantoate--beta-alanine ligase|nr:pantoate--beta-alanine ligase [Peptococcaceae bacterium]